MNGRLACIVPFCNRTAAANKYPPDYEIICGKCWRLVPARVKARQRQLRARMRRLKRRYFLEQNPVRKERIGRIWHRCATQEHEWWQRCKAAAIEAAGGITG